MAHARITQKRQNLAIGVPSGFREVELVAGNAEIIENLNKQDQCVVAIDPGEVVKIHFVRE